ncbi:Fe-S cluster assembly protein HesB [Herbiconiux sp. CPCC 203407]|uniref:Fe-S cluster assembly protein HesB n=1 Tax=Herbiconiux oxytropis TaxID=2970915 RepID=A0AA41XJG6_9MICO|nr:HhH-GPD-type base excision DNA repair protein [Herbiconiux oxytropis]MCS5723302.1 Fe-S cluster assembly protein HesB [Herbiconiux oxytropis]MCS5727844.1 Fe-S cluster assembly protein HesB [Herbiconiux oxytropis]
MTELHITGDPTADHLLSTDPLALLVGMLLDQQIAMETAFEGPRKITERLTAAGATFDAKTLAAYDPEALVELFRETPAVHRYPGSMAARVQSLCAALVDDWNGGASELWTRDDPDGRTLLERLESLPGFGAQKARIFVALLGKQYGVTPDGWRDAAGPYGEEGSYRSVADIVDADSLTRVRETKRAAKAAAKSGKQAKTGAKGA